MSLNLSELTQEKGKPSHWTLNRTVPSPLGEFPMEVTREHGERKPPNEEMLRRGGELVRYVEANGEYLVDIVYGHYLFACKQGWMDYSHFPKGMTPEGLVPEGLTREEIASQLREDRRIYVSEDLDLELDDLPPYESFIYVVPLWDEGHGLTMLFEDGKIVRVNEQLFRLVDGVLEYLDEPDEEEED
jgi:hypothetical protein